VENISTKTIYMKRKKAAITKTIKAGDNMSNKSEEEKEKEIVESLFGAVSAKEQMKPFHLNILSKMMGLAIFEWLY
jgi:hypothetical protein